MEGNQKQEEETEIKILQERDLYKEILKRLDDKAEKGRSAYSLMKNFGFGERLYYNIKDFAEGKKLEEGKRKPLHENKLSELCKHLGIKFHQPMYMVEY